MLTLALAAILANPPTLAAKPYPGWVIHVVTDFKGKSFMFCLPSGYKLTPNPSGGKVTEYEYMDSDNNSITISANNQTGHWHVESPTTPPPPLPLIPAGAHWQTVKPASTTVGDYFVMTLVLSEGSSRDIGAGISTVMGGEMMGDLTPMAPHKTCFNVLYNSSSPDNFERALTLEICTWIAKHNPVSTP